MNYFKLLVAALFVCSANRLVGASIALQNTTKELVDITLRLEKGTQSEQAQPDYYDTVQLPQIPAGATLIITISNWTGETKYERNGVKIPNIDGRKIDRNIIEFITAWKSRNPRYAKEQASINTDDIMYAVDANGKRKFKKGANWNLQVVEIPNHNKRPDFPFDTVYQVETWENWQPK